MSALMPYVLPVMYVLFLWWFSTGAILWLNRRGPRVRAWSFGVMTLVAACSFTGLYHGSFDTGVGGAYHAFTASLLIWGWIEMGFLMGFVTGPRTSPCPADARGWARFRYAFETISYHELALVAVLGAVALLSDGAPNQIGLWTFAVLWLMRLSAKLNVFLGIPNFTDEFLPDHLKYLESYFRVRAINPLFPVTVTLSTGAVVWLVIEAIQPGLTGFEISSLIFLATLLALAVLEHWFMVLPLRDAALWQWALGDKNETHTTTLERAVADPAFESSRPASVPGPS